MTLLISLIIIVIVGSAIFSGLEASLFAVSESRVHVMVRHKLRGAKALLKIKENMQRPIILIVILNNIVNIVGAMIIGIVATETLGSAFFGFVSAGLTILIIIFGEIIPKTVGENNAETIARLSARPLTYITTMLLPFIWVLEQVTKKFSKDRILVSEDDLHVLSQMGHSDGTIEADEKEMIERVFTLNDLSARDVMTPRTVVVAFHKDLKLSEIKGDVYKLVNSRIPVYDEDLDDTVGMCSRRELLISLAKHEDNKKISDFVYDALYVSEDIKIDNLLPLFQKERAHLAIVEDEFGGMAGVVTLEDALEQLVGEIVDETDYVIDTREEARKLADE
jgi:CBS domain containing-hemolysin-like protein